jgi:hypothetical protein
MPDADFIDGVLKVTPLTNAVPEEAEALIRQAYTLLPHVKVTDLLLEVDRWTRFTDDFSHLKKAEPAKDRALLLTVILADGINLGLNKMAEAWRGTSIAKLSWLSAWHIRDETYSKALATLICDGFEALRISATAPAGCVIGCNDGFLRFLSQRDELFNCARINKRLITNKQHTRFHIRRDIDQVLHCAPNRSSHPIFPIYVFNDDCVSLLQFARHLVFVAADHNHLG